MVVLAQNMVCFGAHTLLCLQTDFWLDGFFEVVLDKQLFLSASAEHFVVLSNFGQVGFECLFWAKSSLLLFAYFVVSTVSIQTPHECFRVHAVHFRSLQLSLVADSDNLSLKPRFGNIKQLSFVPYSSLSGFTSPNQPAK